MLKKKVLIHTDFPLANTGFGKNARNILEHLYKTDKYELVNLAVGSVEGNHAELNRTPWKTIGTVNPPQIEQIRAQNDPKNWDGISRLAGYGAYAIDGAIDKVRPDVYIAIQDIWGIDYSIEKPWFNKITSALWTTLDSLPILDKAVVAAQKTKHYWSWADFATKALHKMGHKHVKTLRGSLNAKNFFRLNDAKRNELRKVNNIDPNTFIIGFVFRNQLRKSVPNLIQGFKMFKQANPQIKTKLLLHTSWVEGWNIPKLLEEHGISNSDVLTTYICRNCGKYKIKSFSSNDEDCNFCKAQKSQTTTGPGFGVDENQLNEIYNLMDVYCHPFTSGGQEIPIQEAKLTELVTLVTNYSCGEDSCEEGSGSLALDWAEYREPDTMFIKASTYPNSIAKQLTKVFNMKPEVKKELGKKSRQWVIDNFSTEVIGKFLEDFIDNAPVADYTNAFEKPKGNPNPNYQVPPIKDDGNWILHLYHYILDEKHIDKNDDGYKHWMGRINKDLQRPQIEDYFRQVAAQTIQKAEIKQVPFEEILNKNDKGRILLCCKDGPEDVFFCSSLFKSIKDRYPEWSLYVATKPETKDIVVGNPYVEKWIDWNPMMENPIWAEGGSNHNGYFDICYVPTTAKQNIFNFAHNGIDKLDLEVLNK